MFAWGTGRRWLHGALWSVGLGLVAGGLEAIGLAASLELPLGFGGFLLLGLVAVGSLGLLGGLAGLIAGVVHPLLGGWPSSRAIAAQLGVAAGLLCGWFLWAAAATLVDQGRTGGAAVMALMPLAFVAVVYFNARYWLRRAEVGTPAAVGWLPLTAVVAGLLVSGAALAYAARDTGGAGALAADRSVLLVTVDGLAWEQGPELEEAIVYRDAVSPMPAPLPANTTVLTGLHPLRHGVLGPGDTLVPPSRTLPEVLEEEGYATGAFVSSTVLSGHGLEQGFRTWDDPSPIWAWPSVARRLLPAPTGRRPPAETAARFLGWHARVSAVPFLAWVHLDARGGDVDATMARLAEAVGPEALVVVAGTYGGVRGLSEEAIRVPLVVRAPGVDAVVTEVEPQVRLMDVAPTVLGYLRIDALQRVEGVDLLGYALRLRKAPMWTSLVGDGGRLLGLRNNGVKYVRDLQTGEEHLYDVREDPTEEHDLVGSQPRTLDQARGLVVSEEVALRRLLQ